MVGQGILEKVAMLILGAAWSHRRMLMLYLWSVGRNRNSDVRIAFSAILKIACGDQYALVQNLHRPSTYAPFGGVVKYSGSAKPFLDGIGFKPQTFGPGHDMLHDLRGFLPRRNVHDVVSWFKAGRDRETNEGCVIRELREELHEEVGLMFPIPDGLEFRSVRSVREGPSWIENERYMQLRIFDVIGLLQDESKSEFCMSIMREARTNPKLLLATRREIERGAAGDGRLIAQHAQYLFSGRAMPITIPMIESQPELPGKKPDRVPS
jgi:hypothetical protein